MRVLLVKMSSLGDVIHTLPALTDAVEAMPEIRFDWLVEESFAEIPTWHPAVERVIPIALRRWRKQPLRSWRGSEWRVCRRALKAQRYDAVIDAQGLVKSAWMARYVGGRVHGMDFYSAREAIAACAYSRRYRVAKNLHAVERSRSLFAQALGYDLPTTTGVYGIRQQFQAPAADKPSIIFFHGTARAEKTWPVTHWQALAKLAKHYRVLVPWGSEQERRRGEIIAAAGDNVSLLPRMSLAELAQLLLSVDAAVAVDTGLGHLAAALDVPAISLYGPTDTQLIGAYGGGQLHVTADEEMRATGDAEAMMASISPGAVWEQLQATLMQARQ